MLRIGGGLYVLTGKTGNAYKILKADQWYLANDDIKYIKILEKYQNMPASIKELLKITDEEIIVSPAVKEGTNPLIISRTKNLYLYDLIVNQLGKKFYAASAITGVVDKLRDNREKFELLTIPAQTGMLLNLVKYIGGAYSVDLTLIGGARESGTTTISKNITDLKVSLIEQSATGLYEKETRL